MPSIEVYNRPSIMPGPKVKGDTGLRPGDTLDVESPSRAKSAKIPADKVTINSKLGIEIRPGPTPGHNIIKITNLNTGEVTEIPPVSEADLNAYLQNLLTA